MPNINTSSLTIFYTVGQYTFTAFSALMVTVTVTIRAIRGTINQLVD